MTAQPVPPGDVERLIAAAVRTQTERENERWDDHTNYYDNPDLIYGEIAAAVMAHLTESGYTVVRTDDLRAVLETFGKIYDPLPEDYEAVDRLWAALGEQG